MKYARTPEGYAEYLRSDHWDKLRTCVLDRDGHRCVRCGSSRRLQAHHKFYRDDWEEAQPSDLETLCKACHEKEHPDKRGEVVVTIEVRQTVSRPVWFSHKKDLMRARSLGQITREDFLIARQRLRQEGRWPKGKTKQGKKSSRRRRPIPGYKGCRPWHYSPRRMHWVNRGTSSN